MKTITRICLNVVQRILPDAFVLAILLTFVILGLGLALTGKSLLQMLQYWGDGFSSMYVFGMQMVLVLITGYVLALTPALQKFIDWVTDIPNNPTQALMLTAVISSIASYISWSFSIVIGAIVARYMGRKVKGLHFPLLVAASYSGESIRGLSSSIPLFCGTPGNFMEKLGFPIIPMSQTLFTSWNIALTLVVIAVQALLFYNMRNVTDEIVEFSEPPAPPKPPAKPKSEMTFAERLENTYILNFLIALMPLTYLVMNLSKFGLDLNLNFVILIFFTAGLLLHKDAMGYLDAVKQAIGASRGIVLQFPLYAGMAGMMGKSGLVTIMSNWFVSISTPHTFPLFTFLSAGLVNMFVPSGGGQWAVQGPIMMKAAADLGADIPQTIMAFCWGDGWTNQIQPFWALPLLGVVGLSARDIMGYLVIWATILGLLCAGGFILFSFLF